MRKRMDIGNMSVFWDWQFISYYFGTGCIGRRGENGLVWTCGGPRWQNNFNFSLGGREA